MDFQAVLWIVLSVMCSANNILVLMQQFKLSKYKVELINHFERTSGIFLAYVLNIDVLYSIYMLNIF